MEKLGRYLILTVTTTIGSYLPVLVGSSIFSGWSILGGFVGGIVGIYAIYKLDY